MPFQSYYAPESQTGKNDEVDVVRNNQLADFLNRRKRIAFKECLNSVIVLLVFCSKEKLPVLRKVIEESRD